MDQQPFTFWVPLAMEKSIDDSRMICGIISTEDRDLQDERILEQYSNYGPMLEQMGKNLSSALVDQFDFDRFSTRHGWLKYEHVVGECPSCGAGEASNIIGVPERIEKGVTYQDPITRMVKSGTAIWGRLFAPGVKKSADAAWELIQAIRKSGFDRRLGYSIEGAYVPLANNRDPANKACMVTNVVLTTKPVNSWAWADMAKALVAGTGVTDMAQLEGGGALRKESLHPTPLVTHQGSKKKKCDHADDSGAAKSAIEAFRHLVYCAGQPIDTAKSIVTKHYGL
jgi:hypothetical protein